VVVCSGICSAFVFHWDPELSADAPVWIKGRAGSWPGRRSGRERR
jgi:hypothetical protein